MTTGLSTVFQEELIKLPGISRRLSQISSFTSLIAVANISISRSSLLHPGGSIIPNFSFTITITLRISGEKIATVAVSILSGVNSVDIIKISL